MGAIGVVHEPDPHQEPSAAFARAYGGAVPTHFARAPGRVNLIGEHVDYCGLPVFPIAIQREVRLVFRPREDGQLRVANVNAGFPPRAFAVAREVTPYELGDWGNYLKAAVQGLARRYGVARGMDAVVASDLPIAAGLSSSSALVMATALAVLAANETAAESVELMELMAQSERYVGLRGGGMDQAISLGARRGFAFRIDFDPVRLTPTAVPPDWRFVVADSLRPAPKSREAREAYNARRRDCEAAVERLHERLGSAGGYPDLLAAHSLDSLLAIAAETLEPRLHRRFRHVTTEGARVYEAEAAMAMGDAERFGGLMGASHASLRDDYEVSCPELDALVDLALEAGAVGARLTGAGFGGCTVALCRAETVPAVLGALATRYFAGRQVPGPLHAHLFVAEPSEGASVGTV